MNILIVGSNAGVFESFRAILAKDFAVSGVSHADLPRVKKGRHDVALVLSYSWHADENYRLLERIAKITPRKVVYVSSISVLGLVFLAKYKYPNIKLAAELCTQQLFDNYLILRPGALLVANDPRLPVVTTHQYICDRIKHFVLQENRLNRAEVIVSHVNEVREPGKHYRYLLRRGAPLPLLRAFDVYYKARGLKSYGYTYLASQMLKHSQAQAVQTAVSA